MKIQRLINLVIVVVLLLGFTSVDLTMANQSSWNPMPINNDSIMDEISTLDGSYVPSFGVEVKDTSTLNLVDGGAIEPNNHWVRINGLLWSDAQPDIAPIYNWSTALDEQLQDASDAGMEIILIVRSTPDWARLHNYSCGPMDPPFIDEFADFMSDAVRRYSDPPEPYTFNIKYFEIWNEPDDIPQEGLEENVHGCWGVENDSEFWGGTYYGEVLKAVYPEVKLANPEAQIVVGGLLLPCDPATGVDYCNMSHFFEGILQTTQGEGWPYFDYVAYHGYPFYDPDLSAVQQETPNAPVDGELYWPEWNTRGGLVEGKLNFLNSVMLDYEINKPILLTESGLTDPNFKASDPSTIEVFEATKADYLVWLYSRNIARGIEGTIWYHMDNYGWNKSGLLDGTNTPLPAYDAYAVLTTALDGAIYLRDINDLGAEVLGFEFKKDNRLWVLFSEDDIQKTIPEPDWVNSIYDLFGNTIIPSEGMISFDRPIYINFDNAPPEADNGELTTDEDNSSDIILTANDIDSDVLTWHIVSPPAHGSLSGTAPNITYTPAADYNGIDSFTFNVNDGTVDSNTATVSITVNPVNDAPTDIELNPMSVEENKDEGTQVGTFNTDDVDDGDSHAYALVTGTGDDDNNKFSISGDQLLTNAVFNYEEKSSYSIRVQSTDSGGETFQKAFTITIENINDQPVAEDKILFTSVNIDLAIDLSKFVSDEDTGDELNMVVTITPLYGTLSGEAPNLVYTPDTGFAGMDSFTFSVSDGKGGSDTAVVTISVAEMDCLSLNQTYLNKVLPQDTMEILSLPLENICTYDVGFEIMERKTIVRQDFEEGIMPPTGWMTKVGDGDYNGTFEWTYKDAIVEPEKVDEGRYAAWAGYDPAFKDEWLLTPAFDPADLSDLKLTFRAFSSTFYWDDATMRVWVTDADGDPITDFPEEAIWDMIRDEDWIGAAHRTVYLDLSDFAGYTEPIRLAWQYVGFNGNSFGLDMIDISAASEVDWLSSDPTWGTVSSGDTINIDVTFDSTGLAVGEYLGTLEASPLAPIPVKLFVMDAANKLYLPLIVR
ncbi:Ig-like domain-containing protein [Vibrio sp.]|uniref:Ig-like domain-containing protein n=1 Tax=Vibrio sp. TaxID=678 RepID=UPI003D0CEA2E